MHATSTAARRQARIQSQAVILPRGIDAGQWYDVVPGRRHNDERPGMVLLNLGGSMLHFPERCLEYREPGETCARPGASASAAPAAGAPARGRRRSWTLTGRQLAVAATILPVGLAAVIAGRTLFGDR